MTTANIGRLFLSLGSASFASMPNDGASVAETASSDSAATCGRLSTSRLVRGAADDASGFAETCADSFAGAAAAAAPWLLDMPATGAGLEEGMELELSSEELALPAFSLGTLLPAASAAFCSAAAMGPAAVLGVGCHG